MLTLLGRTVGRLKWLFASIVTVLAGFQLLLIAVAASTVTDGTFERLAQALPAFLRNALGASVASFAGMVTIGYWDPPLAFVVVLFAVYIAAEPAGEVEAGLVDLVLARPLPRHRLVSRSVLAMTAITVAVTVMMGAGTSLGLWLFAPDGVPWPEPRLVLTLMVHLTAVAWCFGAAALASSAFARRRASVVAGVGMVAIVMYILDWVGNVWTPARTVARLSPFHYYSHNAILAGTADPVRDLSVLGAVTIAGIALAYWQFNRRDL